MKLFKIQFLIIALVFFACEEINNTISNVPGDIEEIYEFNLSFSETSDNTDQIVLSWDSNVNVSTFNLEIDGSIQIVSESNNYTMTFLPGTFKNITISADGLLTETIQIFSSPMSPSSFEPDYIGNFKVQYYPASSDGNPPYNKIEIIKSEETDISNIYLYKKTNNNNNIPVYGSDLDLNDWTHINSFDIEQNTIYTENLINNEFYCYLTNTVDNNGNSRFSKIICNEPPYNSMETISVTSISTDLENKISLEWTKYTHNDFYEYAIYRNISETFNDASKELLVKIIDPDQIIFEDRNNIGSGQKLYYQIEVSNQYGYSSKSDIRFGKSKP